MNNKILDKVYGKFNYDTIKTINGFSALLSFILYLVSEFGPKYNYNKNVLFTLFLYSIISYKCKFKDHSKDVLDIKKTYNEFIKEYDKLNKIFDLKNPTEAFTLYNYLLYNGYLSANKNFRYDTLLTREIYPLKGAEIFTGKGKCDNISCMLNDILRENGNDSDLITVDIPNKGAVFYKDEEIKTLKRLKELIKENSNDKEALKVLNDLYSYLPDPDISYKLWARINGEHCFNVAQYNNKCYVLDATNKAMPYYDIDNKTFNIDDDFSGMTVKPYGARKLYGTKNKNVKNKLLLPLSSEEELNSDMDRVWNLCEDNIDIFDKFYNSNKDMYEVTSKKLIKMLRREEFNK